MSPRSTTPKEMTWTAGPYTTDLQKNAALIEEMTEILQLWQPGMTLDELVQRVIDLGGLGRVSRVRINDLVKRAFYQRFLRPDDRPARLAQSVHRHAGAGREYREVLFLTCIRTYPVIFDFLVERYWPALYTGRDVITGAEIQHFIRDKSNTERMPQPWGESVTARVARNLGKTLADFDLFENRRSPLRRIKPWEPCDFLVELVLMEAHERGVGDTALLELPEWRAFGMEKAVVVDRCRRIASSGGPFLFQYSGEIAQFSWRVETVGEYLDARYAA